MKLVGLQNLKYQLEIITSRSDVYKKSGIKVPNFVINLTTNNGQSFVADYITTVLYENKLRKFRGLDPLLEFHLDGSLKQIKRVFADILSSAVYTNEYEGVVAFDISKLSEFINESQIDYFIKRLAEISQYATVIVFYDETLGKSMKQIKDSTIKALGNCIDILVEPYTLADYSEIIVHKIRAKGIEIENEKELEEFLSMVVQEYNVANVKQVLTLLDDLMFYVDYSTNIPKISIKEVNEYYLSIKNISKEKQI